jgi:hypothetical protein
MRLAQIIIALSLVFTSKGRSRKQVQQNEMTCAAASSPSA